MKINTATKSYESYMTVDDVCTYLVARKETVYRWIKNNRMPAYRVGNRWMFQRAEVDKWVKSGKAAE